MFFILDEGVDLPDGVVLCLLIEEEVEDVLSQ